LVDCDIRQLQRAFDFSIEKVFHVESKGNTAQHPVKIDFEVHDLLEIVSPVMRAKKETPTVEIKSTFTVLDFVVEKGQIERAQPNAFRRIFDREIQFERVEVQPSFLQCQPDLKIWIGKGPHCADGSTDVAADHFYTSALHGSLAERETALYFFIVDSTGNAVPLRSLRRFELNAGFAPQRDHILHLRSAASHKG